MNYSNQVERFDSLLKQKGWSINKQKHNFDKLKIEKVKKPKQTLKEIHNIFFGLSKGNLPDKINLLRNQYLKDKKSLGSGCKKCELTALINRYKKRVTDLVNNP